MIAVGAISSDKAEIAVFATLCPMSAVKRHDQNPALPLAILPATMDSAGLDGVLGKLNAPASIWQANRH
jgi:hypothetical protein